MVGPERNALCASETDRVWNRQRQKYGCRALTTAADRHLCCRQVSTTCLCAMYESDLTSQTAARWTDVDAPKRMVRFARKYEWSPSNAAGGGIFDISRSERLSSSRHLTDDIKRLCPADIGCLVIMSPDDPERKHETSAARGAPEQRMTSAVSWT